MNYASSLLCAVSVACVSLPTLSNSKAHAGEDDDLVEKVRQAEDPVELRDVYKKACGSASREELDRLKTCRHPGIAIQAAWEEVRRTIPATPQNPTSNA